MSKVTVPQAFGISLIKGALHSVPDDKFLRISDILMVCKDHQIRGTKFILNTEVIVLARAIEARERMVRHGGKLCVFVSPRTVATRGCDKSVVSANTMRHIDVIY